MRALALMMVALVACGSSTKATEPARPTTTEVHVDRRVELMSFVGALAGFKEYTLGKANAYRSEFVKEFQPYLQHPAVVMLRELRAKRGIGYDAPMIFAVHLDDQLQLVNAAELPELDARWTGVDAEAFAVQLRAFAADTRLDAFLARHRDHYAKLEAALQAAVDAEQPVAWFDAVFGPRDKARYTVVPAPMTGTYNFGVRATRPDGTLDIYQVIAVDTETGLPAIDNDLVYLLIHEMAHSYINPVLARHEPQLGPPAQKLYAQVEPQMRAQAYPAWQVFLNESVVRATTLVYFGEKKGAEAQQKLLADEIARGFRWTAELGALMRAYQHDHEDYVPRLAKLLTELGQR